MNDDLVPQLTQLVVISSWYAVWPVACWWRFSSGGSTPAGVLAACGVALVALVGWMAGPAPAIVAFCTWLMTTLFAVVVVAICRPDKGRGRFPVLHEDGFVRRWVWERGASSRVCTAWVAVGAACLLAQLLPIPGIVHGRSFGTLAFLLVIPVFALVVGPGDGTRRSTLSLDRDALTVGGRRMGYGDLLRVRVVRSWFRSPAVVFQRRGARPVRLEVEGLARTDVEVMVDTVERSLSIPGSPDDVPAPLQDLRSP